MTDQSEYSEQELEDLVIHHKKKYYDGEPEIPDEEYDRLEDLLREMNANNAALFIVGTPVGGKVEHDPPMLSSAKASSLDEVVKWATKIDSRSLYAGYKVDGFSLSIVYDNGVMIQASTRGNGQFGDDVSHAVLKVKDIPKTIPDQSKIDIRGELYMAISEFNRINDELPLEDQFSSPRNLAVGTMKQKDLASIANRKLHFKAFDMIGFDHDKSIHEISTTLHLWGFDPADVIHIEENSPDNIDEVFREIEQKRSELDFEIDGVIFKYNEFKDRQNAGSTEHHPKWQIAWKFASRGVSTKIEQITWQVGRTSVLTPVAEISPVEVSGAMLRRATLHNVDFVEDMNLAIGDTVTVERAGDVIPKIVDIESKGPNSVVFPTICPSCNSPVIREGVNLICTGVECRDRDVQQIIHWLKVIEIEFLGPRSVEKLYDINLIRNFADIYTLSSITLKDVLGKNGEKAYESIFERRNVQFSKFLAGLGINTLGKKMGKVLDENYSSLQELRNTNLKDLVRIEGISDLTANYILEGINDHPIIDQLLENGVEIAFKKRRVKTPKKGNSSGLDAFFSNGTSETTFEGSEQAKLKVYVTGKIPGMTKKLVQQFIEDKGFDWSASISGKLSYLVIGEKAGGAKVDKAKKIGVEILTWDEFIQRIES